MTRTTRTIALLLLASLATSLFGCSSPKTAAEQPPKAASSHAYPVTVTDDTSRTVTVKAEPRRIVSLAPANTEMLFALGVGDRIVGVTSYDDYPAEVADIEKVGDFAGPNIEAVAGANPDVVFVTTGVQADVVTQLEDLGATVIAIDPQTLDGVYEDIAEVASVVGKVEEGNKLIEGMKADAAEVSSAVSGVEPVSTFIEIGQNPLYTVGTATLLDELVRAAGGTNVVEQKGYVPYSSEQLVKADPQVYMATKTTGTDAASLGKRAGYSGLSAVKQGRVVILDDNLVLRPGPRLIEGLRQMAEGLHPEAFGK